MCFNTNDLTGLVFLLLMDCIYYPLSNIKNKYETCHHELFGKQRKLARINNYTLSDHIVS